MASYIKLSKELHDRIQNDIVNGTKPNVACQDSTAIRRNNNQDKQTIWRMAFARDVDKILNSAYYNRYADKTQVFSFYKNDDITRRSLHVQLVSRIARNIGKVLGLNIDLIEAIALGHDIGHTPFGHAGESYLSELYHAETGRYFNHNVHSVRVLDGIFPYNVSLQTLDGILCHNGEFELKEYRPSMLNCFETFDKVVEEAYTNEKSIEKLVPSTLEGCIVRICDIIAYLGKDRQDAFKVNLFSPGEKFCDSSIGNNNAQIINNLVVNIIENSYGKDYIKMDEEYFDQLKYYKKQNNDLIYKIPKVREIYESKIKPMFEQVYKRLIKDLKNNSKSSVIFQHHINFIEKITKYYKRNYPYRNENPNDIVVDYIASMTDDYFIDLHDHLFKGSKYKIEYIQYFDDL